VCSTSSLSLGSWLRKWSLFVVLGTIDETNWKMPILDNQDVNS
jgi:hypothetical protein